MEFQVDEDSGVDGDDGIEDIVIPRVIIDYGATSLDDYNDWQLYQLFCFYVVNDIMYTVILFYWT